MWGINEYKNRIDASDNKEKKVEWKVTAQNLRDFYNKKENRVDLVNQFTNKLFSKSKSEKKEKKEDIDAKNALLVSSKEALQWLCSNCGIQAADSLDDVMKKIKLWDWKNEISDQDKRALIWVAYLHSALTIWNSLQQADLAKYLLKFLNNNPFSDIKEDWPIKSVDTIKFETKFSTLLTSFDSLTVAQLEEKSNELDVIIKDEKSVDSWRWDWVLIDSEYVTLAKERKVKVNAQITKLKNTKDTKETDADTKAIANALAAWVAYDQVNNKFTYKTEIIERKWDETDASLKTWKEWIDATEKNNVIKKAEEVVKTIWKEIKDTFSKLDEWKLRPSEIEDIFKDKKYSDYPAVAQGVLWTNNIAETMNLLYDFGKNKFKDHDKSILLAKNWKEIKLSNNADKALARILVAGISITNKDLLAGKWKRLSKLSDNQMNVIGEKDNVISVSENWKTINYAFISWDSAENPFMVLNDAWLFTNVAPAIVTTKKANPEPAAPEDQSKNIIKKEFDKNIVPIKAKNNTAPLDTGNLKKWWTAKIENLVDQIKIWSEVNENSDILWNDLLWKIKNYYINSWFSIDKNSLKSWDLKIWSFEKWEKVSELNWIITITNSDQYQRLQISVDKTTLYVWNNYIEILNKKLWLGNITTSNYKERIKLLKDNVWEWKYTMFSDKLSWSSPFWSENKFSIGLHSFQYMTKWDKLYSKDLAQWSIEEYFDPLDWLWKKDAINLKKPSEATIESSWDNLYKNFQSKLKTHLDTQWTLWDKVFLESLKTDIDNDALNAEQRESITNVYALGLLLNESRSIQDSAFGISTVENAQWLLKWISLKDWNIVSDAKSGLDIEVHDLPKNGEVIITKNVGKSTKIKIDVDPNNNIITKITIVK